MRHGRWMTRLTGMLPFAVAGVLLAWQVDVPAGISRVARSLAGDQDLFPVLVDGKVGYIDREGRVVWQPTR